MSRRSTLASVSAVVGAVLVPKCPFCIAAALVALGVGGSFATDVAPLVRPAAIVVAAVALLVSARAAWRRRVRCTC